ncbi:hypothetical protein BC830DRAFT_14237 [Chytriomyces sp. MP71]|nr:hypothetical protein BC830DRAFT_14237 [Chytriomyces sp. MP71]
MLVGTSSSGRPYCLSCNTICNNLVLNLITATAKHEDLLVYLASYADNWCSNKNHVFSNGCPDNHQAQCFLLQLIKNGRVTIRRTCDAYVRFSKAKYDEHIKWYLEHLDSVDGVELDVRIELKSKQCEGERIGCDSYAGFTADCWDSALGCDAIGQCGIAMLKDTIGNIFSNSSSFAKY